LRSCSAAIAFLPDGAAEHGHINAEILARHVGDLASPIFYAAGPSAMVSAMVGILAGAGISRKNVRTKQFAGY